MRLSSDQTAAGLLFVAIGVLASQAPVQSDTWWLLRAGFDIWETWRVPLVDSYSHTAAGRYWWNHEWLTEVLFYGLFHLGGLPLLAACCAGAVVATWAIIWRTCRARFELVIIVIGLGLVSAAQSWAVRPQVLSALLFAAVMRLSLDDRKAIWIPAVVVLWVNLHGAAVSSLVLVAGAACGRSRLAAAAALAADGNPRGQCARGRRLPCRLPHVHGDCRVDGAVANERADRMAASGIFGRPRTVLDPCCGAARGGGRLVAEVGRANGPPDRHRHRVPAPGASFNQKRRVLSDRCRAGIHERADPARSRGTSAEGRAAGTECGGHDDGCRGRRHLGTVSSG